LYIWWKDRFQSSESNAKVAQHRLISVCGSAIVSVLLLRLLCSKYDLSEDTLDFFHFMGVRPGANMVFACLCVASLTFIMFLGPFIMTLTDGYLLQNTDNQSFRIVSYFSKEFLAELPRIVRETVKVPMFWCAIVVGPLTEEIVYRACMCSVLKAAGYGNLFCCIIPPLCFGLAHVHHLIHNLRQMSVLEAVLTALLQLSYTTVFGAFSCYVYLRTGHLSACIVSHTICNSFGFPDFEGLAHHEHRLALTIAFAAGVVLFFVLLAPLTSPSLFPVSSMW